jgi:hypothetical protein
MHGKYHKVLARHILEPYTKEEQALLMSMVAELDKYLESQASRYIGSESVRKTAKEVADKTRRRNDDG